MPPVPPTRAATGVDGIDHILGGGLPRHRIHLVSGNPGTGKTTFAIQFLLAGAAAGEAGLYVTLSETSEELGAVAESHGWSLEKLSLYELGAADQSGTLAGAQTLFHPSEIELNETTRGVLAVVDRERPQRVVFDSLSEMRLLARDPLRYRRQILALKQFFIGRGCTVLLLDDLTSAQGDLQLESLAHGVIEMEQRSPIYGAERRRLRVKKMRGTSFRGGYHDFRILTGGIDVYPRLVAAEHHSSFQIEPLASGIPGLDALLGGGLDRGTSTLIVGPVGTGKTTLALQFALSAAASGKRAALYMFEEGLHTISARAAGLKMPLAEMVEAGRVVMRQVDPAELTPGELAREIYRQVEEQALKFVVLDTLNGYMSAMPEEHFLILHLHELLSALGQVGVTTVLIEAQHGPVGAGIDPLQVSFLADTVLLLRHFESRGALRQAVSVLKKRTGRHERTIRELFLDADGLRIGPALTEFQGVLSGTPVHVGPPSLLMESRDGKTTTD